MKTPVSEFKKEDSMLAKFRCAEIIDLYRPSLAPNHLCLVMEYTPHHSKQDLIEKGADVAFATRVGFLQSASRGLASPDVNGILHLDNSPANVLVFSCSSTVSDSLKLSLFGRSTSFIQSVNRLFTNLEKLPLVCDWP